LSPEPVRRSGAKFRAYRAWTLDGYRLRSANPAGGHWTAGVNRAECRRSTYDRVVPMPTLWPAPELDEARATHRAPDPRCRCGLYAWHEPEQLTGFVAQRAELVYGAVLAWGRVEVHADGMRAQHARVEALALGVGERRRDEAKLRSIASALGVELVEWNELDVAADRCGRPLPDEMIAAATTRVPDGGAL
jgi:hypothetical protein